MADFKQRQDQLRIDLRILLIKKYSNNRSAMAEALNVLPKVLRDFLEEGVFMQAANYNSIIETLKNLPFPLHSLGIAEFVRLFENIDANDSESLEKLVHETYDPIDVERLKLMRYFLEGGTLNDIRSFDILKELKDAEQSLFTKDVHVGLIDAINNDYTDFFEKHDTLADYKYMLDELNNKFASYMFGYRVPNYFLDENDNQKAVIIFMTGLRFQEIRDKGLTSQETSSINLSADDMVFCSNCGYDIRSDHFVRSFANFLNPAKMSKR